MKTFETFKCSCQNLSNSLCQFWNSKSVPLQILYPYSILWKITALYFLSSKNIYFPQKEHIKMKIFETFNCSGQNLSNSSCQLGNDESIPLQILCHFSLSWQITPLWILSSYFFNFGLTYPNKIPILTLKCSGKNLPYSSCHFSFNFNFLDFPLLVWSYPNSSYDLRNLESVLYKFCTILQ